MRHELPGKFFSHFSQFPGLRHQVFSRQGGVSQKEFSSLNVAIHTGDSESSVRENRKRIHECLRTDHSLYVQQVHGKEILVLKSKEITSGNLQKIVLQIHTADGMITDIKNLALMIQTADCQAIMLYDPVKQVIANVHSGWRGSVQNIIGYCLDLMQKEFDSSPAHILAGICPSLGPCCAEFINYKKEIPSQLWKYKDTNQDYFDFWRISQAQLQEKGVLKKNIELMGICTKCDHEHFFSYRHSHRTGRFACGLVQI